MMSGNQLESYLWLGGFTVAFVVHLWFHPLRRIFRDSIRWLGEHPMPVLWLSGSMMFAGSWLSHSIDPEEAAASALALSFWPEAWVQCFMDALRRLALLFHQAILPPPILQNHVAGAFLSALLGAVSQVILCSTFVHADETLLEERLALKKTLRLWKGVLLLALFQLPWRLVETGVLPGSSFLSNWLLPEWLLFLAPLPLALVLAGPGIVAAGVRMLQMWRAAWLPMLGLLATVLPLLALVEFHRKAAYASMLGSWTPVRIILESVVVSTVHLWVFVCAALLLRRGKKPEPESSQPPADSLPNEQT